MHRDAQKIINVEIRDTNSNLCAKTKLETDRLRGGGGGGAPWAIEIYLPPPFLHIPQYPSGHF